MTKRKLSNPEYNFPVSKSNVLEASDGDSSQKQLEGEGMVRCSSPKSTCPLLDDLPAEIRLSIYESVLRSERPVQGKVSKNRRTHHFAGNAKNCGFSLAILRVNRQIHAEAQPIFYQVNTFHLSNLPLGSSTGTYAPGIGVLDPPIKGYLWPLLRHLTIDLLFVPPDFRRTSDEPLEDTWSRDDPRCTAYIRDLANLLEVCGPRLKSVTLLANVPDTVSGRKSIASFFICDRERAFARAVSKLNVEKVALHFDFADSYFYIDIYPRAFLSRSILLMACQVMFCQSQARIDKLIAAFNNGTRLESPAQSERTDLSPLIYKNRPLYGTAIP